MSGHQRTKHEQVKGKRLALMLESDGPGGAESVIITLAEGMRARGVDVRPVVFAPGQGWMSGRLKSAGFELFQPTLSRPFDPMFVRQLRTWLETERIQHIHAHEFTMGFYAGAAGSLAGIPHTLTMHGGIGFAAALRRRVALSASARRASAIVGVSEETCEHLAESLWLRRSRISMVPNGVLVKSGDRAAGRTSLMLGDQTRLILAVGNLYPVKGHRTLVEAAIQMAACGDLPDWQIAIAGRGDERPYLEKMIAEHRLESRVRLLGLRDDIPSLLAAADGWVMPSLSEGLPMALLEAMFAGVPVVCSAVGGIPTLVQPGTSGWLVPPSDPASLARALMEMIRNRALAERYRNEAKRIVEASYGHMTMVDRYLDLYAWL